MKPLLSLMTVVLAATSAWGQGTSVEKDKQRTETLKVQLGGDVNLRFIGRSEQIAQWRSGGTGGSETEFSPDVWVKFDAELIDKVSAHVELGMDPLANIGTPTTPIFGETYVKFSELLSPAITLKFGQIHDRFDPRNTGSSLVYDSFWSEAPSYSQSLDGRSTTTFYAYSAGVVADYAGEGWSFHLASFPKINDGADPSEPSQEEALHAASLSYNLDFITKMSRFDAVAAILASPTSDNQANLFGGSLDIFLFEDDSLEVFFEGYGNTGDSGDKIDARGFALEGGVKVTFASDRKPWLQVKYTYLSGDNDAADDENKNYISRENQHDLMILESDVFGIDWDTNMEALKMSGGIGLTVGSGTARNVFLEVIGALTRTPEDVGTEHRLGNELDAKITYKYNPAVSIEAGGALITGSEIMRDLTAKGDAKGHMGWIGATLKW